MARLTRMTRKRLGDVLIEHGLVDEAAVKEALKEQRRTGELLGEVLVRLGYVTEMDIAGAIVTQFALPYIRISQYRIAPEILKIFPPQMMRQYRFMPLDRMGEVVAIAVGGLLNEDVLSELEKVINCKVLVYISAQSEVSAAIQKHFPETAEEAAASAGRASEAAALAEAALAEMASGAGGSETAEEGVEIPAPAARAQQPEPEPAEDLSSLGSLLLGDEKRK